ncbi:P-loop containing nucleoside triphosphate hydrolase protein [Lanmaoa asiatica]|nr:P-loop containing nucleoside triphosphate hydrolase protein [Lanmaoa asiatica]
MDGRHVWIPVRGTGRRASSTRGPSGVDIRCVNGNVIQLKKKTLLRTKPVGGEKQRLATARMFMRINNRTTRLVVVDEATSSLDPVAERDILTEFRKVRAGKTIVCVTHRFYHLVHEADRILCMKDGCVVENGTHAELVRVDGDYAALYHAQAE